MAETKRIVRKPKASTAKAVDEYGHLQPQAIEFEEAVLGALMIERDAYSLVSEILRPESFYERDLSPNFHKENPRYPNHSIRRRPERRKFHLHFPLWHNLQKYFRKLEIIH